MQSKSLKVVGLVIGVCLVILTIDLFSQTAKIRIIKDQAVLRLKPSDESPKIKELPIGSEFSVEETVGDWVKIKMPPDVDNIVIAGYVHMSFVEFEIEPTQIRPEVERPLAIPVPEAETPLMKPNDELVSWQKDMTRARAKLRSGNTIGWVGAATSLFGWCLYAFDKEKTLESELLGTEGKGKVEYLITGISGMAMALIGMVLSETAKNEIEALQVEGAKKRFITGAIGVINGGVAFTIEVSF